MAFILDDQEPSITSESAPFIPAVDYDSDVELFQVPIKRGSSPFKVPHQDSIPTAALRYAAPPAPSEESLSTNSQPTPDSRDTSPHKKPSSSPPSSVGSVHHDIQDEQQKHSNASTQKSKILQATQLHLTKGKAKPVQTKRPKKLILPLKAHLYELEESEDDEDFTHIHEWLEQCHVSTVQKTEEAGRAIIAGSQLLHPFLGPALLSPPMGTEPKVYAINIHGTLAHHTNTQQAPHAKEKKRPNLTRQNAEIHHLTKEDVGLSDRNSGHMSTTDSAYDRAREMEIYLSKHIAISRPDTQLKGKSHWFIDANLTEASHFRLAKVARSSAEGFDALRRHHLAAVAAHPSDYFGVVHGQSGTGEESYSWGPGGVFVPKESGLQDEQQQRMVESQTAAELAELYRALAAVHVVFGEEMRAERERLAGGGQGLEGLEEEGESKDGERGRGRYREQYAGAREHERQQERKRDLERYDDQPGMVRRRSMGSKIGSLRGRRRRRVVS
ncbi:hypothetical protein QBC37DRAFT_403706 [Rhypophila decipiens]|uniref:Uncharacterized protein n=1 Tax=Rhypophila decipiens TaxID=261697 RepID=A0AAN6Y0M5_9PEZI|nr:hypothetical protein QBC37DRAFT_403706 [Rhypophila decipiens]